MARVVHFVLWKTEPYAKKSKLIGKLKRLKSEIPGIEQLHVGVPKFFEFPKKMAERFGIDFSIRKIAHWFNLILFIVFDSEKSRKAYDSHPSHMALPDYTANVLKPGPENVMVIDFTVR